MLQADVHAAYGGVVPNLAMEAHKAAMDSCVDHALQQAGITAQDLSAVAVSIGPGLSPCLQVCPCIYLAGFAPESNSGWADVHASHKSADTMTHCESCTTCCFHLWCTQIPFQHSFSACRSTHSS